MLTEDRVRLMTRMAIFEKNNRNEYLPFTDINKKDYVGSKRLIAFVVFTIGYLACAGGLVILMLFNLQLSADVDTLLRVAMIIALLYILLLIVILYSVHRMASKRYRREAHRIEKYRRWYDELEAMYRREDASTSPSPENVAIATERFGSDE